MPQSSEFGRGTGLGVGQGAGGTDQSGEVAARDPAGGARSAGSASFRYAPLSGGLEIVRKTLGRHEIATIQIDRDRPRQRHGPAHHHAGACLRRMDRLGLAGLSAVGTADAAPHGRRADLRPALCACSPWSGLPARTISTRRVCRCRSDPLRSLSPLHNETPSPRLLRRR